MKYKKKLVSVVHQVNKIYSKSNPSTYLKNFLNKKNVETFAKNRIDFFLKLKLTPKLFKDSDLLDLGCGTGQNSIAFSIMEANCTLIDYDKESCDRANLVFKKFSKNKFKIIKSDIFKYKDNKKYDFVVSNGVAHHTKSSSKILNIACSKVKKNGFIIYGIANQSGMFQRNLMRLILFSISKNNNDIMHFAKVLFKDSIDRSIKFSGRSAEEIISDTFLNPKFSAVKPLSILNTFNKYSIDLYSSFPDFKDIETFINTEHMQFKLTNNKSKKIFNKDSIHLHDFQSLSLNKNKNKKDVI
ncbi:class I SAM-dependent methyltransferase, partial [Candidatus Pelagibacter ubique]|nr:class I SAM-dependent methyltransferase [Candidatus Pelagibacter ubique]